MASTMLEPCTVLAKCFVIQSLAKTPSSTSPSKTCGQRDAAMSAAFYVPRTSKSTLGLLSTEMRIAPRTGKESR
eukprot:scaffold1204_cov407-Prasinococcus_capsulatus_cf.AAC.11